MSSLQDMMSNAYLNGNAYQGTVPAQDNILFGLYNPATSGLKCLITRIRIQNLNNVPYRISQSNSFGSPQSSLYYMPYATVPVPAAVNGNCFGNVAADPQSLPAPLGVLQAVTSSVYAPAVNGHTRALAVFPVPPYRDIQVGETYDLQTELDILNTFPLILPPGTYLGGSNAYPINPIAGAAAGIQVYVSYVQLPL